MPKIAQPKHTDVDTFDGDTGEWKKVPRMINDNVASGGEFWTTQGDIGIVNAGLVEEVILDAFRYSEGKGTVPVSGSKKVDGKGSSKKKDS
jgi:hypothetical protein